MDFQLFLVFKDSKSPTWIPSYTSNVVQLLVYASTVLFLIVRLIYGKIINQDLKD
ncbi:unnamed protein product [Prunus armeniaca]|uniref:Uncharacterized protein n=1 Tax=Prunus armeniaca TaxID=36596 RepID=A0A6J5X9N5_PRUAR|nr:unnamed protein product [Prunus armeniaca]